MTKEQKDQIEDDQPTSEELEAWDAAPVVVDTSPEAEADRERLKKLMQEKALRDNAVRARADQHGP